MINDPLPTYLCGYVSVKIVLVTTGVYGEQKRHDLLLRLAGRNCLSELRDMYLAGMLDGLRWLEAWPYGTGDYGYGFYIGNGDT